MRQLEEEYQSIISALRSKLNSKAPPPILDLDIAYLREDIPNIPAFPTGASPTAFPKTSLGSPSLPQESQETDSLLTALMSEVRKFGTGIATGDTTQRSVTAFGEDAFPDVTPTGSAGSSEGPDGVVVTDLTPQSSPSTVLSTTSTESSVDSDSLATTSEPRPTLLPVSPSLHPAHFHRKRRSLRKRQLPAAKSMYHTYSMSFY